MSETALVADAAAFPRLRDVLAHPSPRKVDFSLNDGLEHGRVFRDRQRVSVRSRCAVEAGVVASAASECSLVSLGATSPRSARSARR